MWSRRIAAFVVIVALAGVVFVSAGSLTTSTGGTNAGGTLLQAQWSQGCVNNVNLRASHVGPNQCDPQRDAGTAWYCRLSSSGGVGVARQMCYEDFNGCSCNANNGGRNDYWCRGTPENNPCESCVPECNPACPSTHTCEGAVTGDCDEGTCVCNNVRCAQRNTPCSGGSCSYPADECVATGTWNAGSRTVYSCNSANQCVGSNQACDTTGTCTRSTPSHCDDDPETCPGTCRLWCRSDESVDSRYNSACTGVLLSAHKYDLSRVCCVPDDDDDLVCPGTCRISCRSGETEDSTYNSACVRTSQVCCVDEEPECKTDPECAHLDEVEYRCTGSSDPQTTIKHVMYGLCQGGVCQKVTAPFESNNYRCSSTACSGFPELCATDSRRCYCI